MVLRKKGEEVTDELIQREMAHPSMTALSQQDVLDAVDRGAEVRSSHSLLCSLSSLIPKLADSERYPPCPRGIRRRVASRHGTAVYRFEVLVRRLQLCAEE